MLTTNFTQSVLYIYIIVQSTQFILEPTFLYHVTYYVMLFYEYKRKDEKVIVLHVWEHNSPVEAAMQFKSQKATSPIVDKSFGM